MTKVLVDLGVVERALEALEPQEERHERSEFKLQAAHGLREVLAQPIMVNVNERQEPVALGLADGVGSIIRCIPICSSQLNMYKARGYTIPLYLGPQPSKEVELTNEDIAEALGEDLSTLYSGRIAEARAVITKYKEKNQ